MENQKKIIAQKKNKKGWGFGVALTAVVVIILAATCIPLIFILTKKKVETEAVTKVQRLTAKHKSDLEAEIARLQDEVKKNVVQGEKKANLEAEIAHLQDEVKKIDAFNNWNNSLHKEELEIILKDIDASVKVVGGELKLSNFFSKLTRYQKSFEKLIQFVKDRTKRQLLVNSGQTSKNQKEQDFYLFVKMLDQATELKKKNNEQAEAEYNFLLEKVKNKFGAPFHNKFNAYFVDKKEDNEYTAKNILSQILKHIFSDLKIRDNQI